MYWLQLGWKRQFFPSSGDMPRWYIRTRPIAQAAGIFISRLIALDSLLRLEQLQTIRPVNCQMAKRGPAE
jgi:hypothetical protein